MIRLAVSITDLPVTHDVEALYPVDRQGDGAASANGGWSRAWRIRASAVVSILRQRSAAAELTVGECSRRRRDG